MPIQTARIRKSVHGLVGLALAMTLAACASGKTTGEVIDDSTIGSSVKMNLVGDATAPGTSINVETYKGTVQLIGFVSSEEQKQAAIAVAKDTKGVTKVEDAMVIVPEKRSFGTSVDDQTIQTKVKFDLSEVGAGETVSVVTDVRNGEVLLGGFVDTAEHRDQIAKVAEGIKGVTKVHNHISVRQ